MLNPKKSKEVLYEIHEGESANHFKRRALAWKIMMSGYYWPTLTRGELEYVKKCDKCQRHRNYIHIPSDKMKSILSPYHLAK